MKIINHRAGVALVGAAILAATMGVSGCPAKGGNGDSTPQPGHTTTVGPRPTGPSATVGIIPKGDAPAGALCHDATVVTTAAQCADHGGVAEG